MQATKAEPITDALAEGRDGRMYFLVHRSGEAGDFVLDHYDPVRSVVERVPLHLKDAGLMTMVSGKDGLYFAAFSAQRGRRKVSWEDFDRAVWKPVQSAKIGGLEQGQEER